jgi:hypothetical protein
MIPGAHLQLPLDDVSCHVSVCRVAADINVAATVTADSSTFRLVYYYLLLLQQALVLRLLLLLVLLLVLLWLVLLLLLCLVTLLLREMNSAVQR